MSHFRSRQCMTVTFTRWLGASMTMLCVSSAALADRGTKASNCVPAGELGAETLRLTVSSPEWVDPPQLAFNSVNDEFGVTWGELPPGNETVILMRRLAASGQPNGVPTLVAEPDVNNVLQSSIAHNPASNRYFVAWRSVASGPPPADYFNHAFGRMVNSQGNPDGPIEHISESGMESTVIFNSTTEDFFHLGRTFYGGPGGIFSRRISGDGVPQDSFVQLNQTLAAAPPGRAAFNTKTGEYLATWRDQEAGLVLGRLLNPQGLPVGPERVLNSTFPGTAFTTGVAYDPNHNRYLVVFSQFTGGEIRAQFVDADGMPEGSTIVIETAKSMEPAIAFDPVNNVFLVVWRHADYYSLTGQLIGLDGTSIGEKLILSEGGLGGSPYTGGVVPNVAANTNSGGFLVTWRCYAPFFPYDEEGFARFVNVTCAVPGDLNGDGVVDVSDLLILLSAWGACSGCSADLNGDGVVDVSDMLILLSAWG